MESVPNPFLPARRRFSKIGVALAVMAAIAVALQAGLSYALAAAIKAGKLSAHSWLAWLGTLAFYLIAVPVGILLFRRIPAEPAPKSRLGARRFLSFLLMCFPVMYGGNLIGTLLALILTGGSAKNGLISLVLDPNPLKIVVAVILGPAIEEYIFRRQIIDHARKYGEGTAILLSAFAFALFHMNLYQAFYAFGVGLLFAYVYTRTGRLRYTIALHVVINFLGAVAAPWIISLLDSKALSGVNAAGAATAHKGVIGLLVFGLYLLLMLGLTIAGIVQLNNNKKKFVLYPAAEELAKGRRIPAAYLNPGMLLYILLCLGMTAYALLVRK